MSPTGLFLPSLCQADASDKFPDSEIVFFIHSWNLILYLFIASNFREGAREG